MPRIRTLDNPDSLLAGCVVLVTKYLFPMDGIDRYPLDAVDPLAVKMDWNVWLEAMKTTSDRHDDQQLGKISARRAWSMTPEQQDENLDWYQDTYIQDSTGLCPLDLI